MEEEEGAGQQPQQRCIAHKLQAPNHVRQHFKTLNQPLNPIPNPNLKGVPAAAHCGAGALLAADAHRVQLPPLQRLAVACVMGQGAAAAVEGTHAGGVAHESSQEG